MPHLYKILAFSFVSIGGVVAFGGQPMASHPLKDRTISGPITLQYRVTKRDTRDSNTVDQQLAGVAEAYEMEVRLGKRTQASADESLATLKKAIPIKMPNEVIDMTLASDGRRMLLETRAAKARALTLYDGKRTYTITAPGMRLSDVQIAPKFEIANFEGFPFIGANLSALPFVAGLQEEAGALRGEILLPSARVKGRPGPGYVSALITTRSSPAPGTIRRILFGNTKYPGSTIEVSESRLVDGVPIFGRYKFSEIVYSGPNSPASKVSEADVVLKGIERKAPKENRFDIYGYLRNGMRVEYDDGNSVVVFTYDPKGGSLEQQRAKQVEAMKGEAMQAKRGDAARARNGTFLLWIGGALLFIGATTMLYRWRKDR